MVTTSVTIEEFIPGDRYNAGTIQQRQVDVELVETTEDSEWVWIDKKYTYDIMSIHKKHGRLYPHCRNRCMFSLLCIT